MDWHDGYVSGIDYVVEFFQEQGPTHLNVACVINGVEPIAPGRPFTYFELGCGQGLTANVLAAGNPHGAFFAADFNPAHIAGAQQLAEQAGLSNLRLLENSFAELAGGQVDLPQMDYISLHGVYSWVKPEQRVFVTRFIERYLKPGGVLHVTYNAMPGWSSALPLQRLLLEHVGMVTGTPQQKIHQARQLIKALTEAKAAYFCQEVSVNLQHVIDLVLEDGKNWSNYLAHEYMNQGWEPLYHADVVDGLANCKLDYVGSTDYCYAYPHLYLNAEQRALLAGIDDGALRETVKDYIRDTSFRSDVYVKGARPMSASRQLAWFEQTAIVLTSLRENVDYAVKLPIGRVEFVAPLLDAVLDALEGGPKTFGELLALPALAGEGPHDVMELMALLANAKHAQIYFPGTGVIDNKVSTAFNDAMLELNGTDSTYAAFAAPLVGGGVKNGLLQRLVYQWLRQGKPATDAEGLAEHVYQTMMQRGVPIGTGGGADACTPAQQRAEVGQSVAAILARRVPIWNHLQVLQ